MSDSYKDYGRGSQREEYYRSERRDSASKKFKRKRAIEEARILPEKEEFPLPELDYQYKGD